MNHRGVHVERREQRAGQRARSGGREAGGRALQGRQPVAVFDIGRNGQISGLTIETTSGNPWYDQAALRAILGRVRDNPTAAAMLLGDLLGKRDISGVLPTAHALSNAFAFGGLNAVLVLRRS